MPEMPGDLLAWSLALVFGAVFFAVLSLSFSTRPGRATRLSHRIGKPQDAESRGRRDAAAKPWSNPVSLAVLSSLILSLGFTWLSVNGTLSWLQGLVQGAVSIALTWGLLDRYRAWRVSRRRDALHRGFPDALDMMVVCVEAGLGLDAALNRVAAEIAEAHAGVAAELAQVGLELRAGRERGEVLRAFSKRTGLPEMASFATLLIQSEALGTGIARGLRVQAEDMRSRRMQRAEELAHTLPVKLTIPLVFCVMPAMVAAVLLPSALNILRDVLPNLGH